MRRQLDGSAEVGAGNRGQRERPKKPPQKMPGAKKQHRADERHRQIQGERGGLHHDRSDARERHDGEVTGSAAVSDHAIQCGDEKQRNKQDKPIGRHLTEQGESAEQRKPCNWAGGVPHGSKAGKVGWFTASARPDPCQASALVPSGRPGEVGGLINGSHRCAVDTPPATPL